MIELLEFALPEFGFSSPVAMWLACHHRLEGVCSLLRRVGVHVADFGTDESMRTAADGLRRYFNLAMPRHQQDEDTDLFPRALERLRGRQRATVRAVVDRLQEDHGAAERLWHPLDGQLADLQQGGRTAPDRQQIDRLAQRLLNHRDAEESALLGILQSALQPADLAEAGEAMAKRRGLSWKRLNSGRA